MAIVADGTDTCVWHTSDIADTYSDGQVKGWLDADTDMTCAFWLYVTTTPGGSGRYIWALGDRDTPSDIDVYGVAIDAPTGTGFRIQFFRDFGTTVGEWRTDNDYDFGVWYSIIITYDSTGTAPGNDPVFWINGSTAAITEDATPAGTQTGGADHLILLNTEHAGSQEAPAGTRLAALAFWDRVLTDEEIAAVYEAGPWVIPRSRKMFYPLIRDGVDVDRNADVYPGGDTSRCLGHSDYNPPQALGNWRHFAYQTGRPINLIAYIEGFPRPLCSVEPSGKHYHDNWHLNMSAGDGTVSGQPWLFGQYGLTFIAICRITTTGTQTIFEHVNTGNFRGVRFQLTGTRQPTIEVENHNSTAYTAFQATMQLNTTGTNFYFLSGTVSGKEGTVCQFLAIEIDGTTGLPIEETTETVVVSTNSYDDALIWSQHNTWTVTTNDITVGVERMAYFAVYRSVMTFSEIRSIAFRKITPQWRQWGSLVIQYDFRDGERHGAGAASGTTVRNYSPFGSTLDLSLGGGTWVQDTSYALYDLTYHEGLGLPTEFGQEVDIKATKSTIQAYTFVVLDPEDKLTNFLSTTNFGIGLHDKKVYLFVGFDGLIEEEYELFSIGLIDTIESLSVPAYRFSIGDMARVMKRPYLLWRTTVNEALDISETDFDMTTLVSAPAKRAGGGAAAEPSFISGAMRVDNEIILISGANAPPSLTIPTGTRGALGSTAATHNTGRDAQEILVNHNEGSNTTNPAEYLLQFIGSYLGGGWLEKNFEGQDSSIVARLFTRGVNIGADVGDGVDGNGIGLGTFEVDYEGIYEIMVTEGFTGANYDGDIRITQDIDDIKDFVEKEILRMLGAFFYTRRDGRLTIGTWSNDIQPTHGLLRAEDMEKTRFRLDRQTIVNAIQFRHTFDPVTEQFDRIVQFEDVDSQALYGRKDAVTIRSHLINDTTSSPANVGNDIKNLLFARFNEPQKIIETTVGLEWFDLEIGAILQIDHPDLPDLNDGKRGIQNDQYQVIGKNIDLLRGAIGLKLIEVRTDDGTQIAEVRNAVVITQIEYYSEIATVAQVEGDVIIWRDLTLRYDGAVGDWIPAQVYGRTPANVLSVAGTESSATLTTNGWTVTTSGTGTVTTDGTRVALDGTTADADTAYITNPVGESSDKGGWFQGRVQVGTYTGTAYHLANSVAFYDEDRIRQYTLQRDNSTPSMIFAETTGTPAFVGDQDSGLVSSDRIENSQIAANVQNREAFVVVLFSGIDSGTGQSRRDYTYINGYLGQMYYGTGYTTVGSTQEIRIGDITGSAGSVTYLRNVVTGTFNR